MPCLGNQKDHCCYIKGKACPHLEKNTALNRKWVCGLRKKYGHWDLVLNSEEYKKDVAPHFEPQGINCRDWPDFSKGQYCGDCGAGM
jgi:hypothetical protein